MCLTADRLPDRSYDSTISRDSTTSRESPCGTAPRPSHSTVMLHHTTDCAAMHGARLQPEDAEGLTRDRQQCLP